MGAPTRARFLNNAARGRTVTLVVLVAALLSVLGGLSIGELLATGAGVSPVDVVVRFVRRTSSFTGLHVLGMVLCAILVAAAICGGYFLLRRLIPRPSWIDVAARHLASPKELTSLSQKAVTAKALSVGGDVGGWIGTPLGRHVNGGACMYASVEDLGLLFAGPRVGKTSSYGIPLVLNAPGAVLATENKRTLHDHTRGIRELVGTVFTFDPQGIVGAAADWWTNPLRAVRTDDDAVALAALFAKAEQDAVAAMPGGDFFEIRATTLLRCLFLAAAHSEGYVGEYSGPQYWLDDVYAWLGDPGVKDPIPVAVLESSGYPAVLNELISIYTSAPEERSGVFSTALVQAKSLGSRQISKWVNPTPEDLAGTGRMLFDPAKFLAGSNTLYCLSKDTTGSARALVTALTVQVCAEAERIATHSPYGRLAVPFFCVLDEAANVCRWPELPKLYSHYGSRGILLAVILQSYAQGERVWGRDGMRTLLEAANWIVYAGGNKPGELLRLLSAACGEYYYTTLGSPASRNSGPGRPQEHKDHILDESELSALPRGRAVLLTSGNRPALIRTIPWMHTPHAASVAESLKKYDPAPEKTITEAHDSIVELRRNPDSIGRAA